MQSGRGIVTLACRCIDCEWAITVNLPILQDAFDLAGENYKVLYQNNFSWSMGNICKRIQPAFQGMQGIYALYVATVLMQQLCCFLALVTL